MCLVKTFSDGSTTCFGTGKIDNWCVYNVDQNGYKKAPRDVDYFTFITDLNDIYGSDIVYNLIYEIFKKTTNNVDMQILEYITQQCKEKFGSQSLEADKNITFIYMGMIAEENKKNAVVKKRIKMLGIHYLLKENKSVDGSANCLRGVDARTILKECRIRNI